MPKVTFLPSKREITVNNGTTLFIAAQEAGIALQTPCGGKGTCGKCKVRIVGDHKTFELTGEVNKHLSPEEMADGWVLACRYEINEDLTVEVPQFVDAAKRKVDLSVSVCEIDETPVVEKKLLNLEKPTVHDSRADWERLAAALPEQTVEPDLGLLRSLPHVFRGSDFQVTALIRQNRVFAVEPGDTTAKAFGLAVDIGTTTVVGWLMNLQDGRALAAAAVTNPQQAFGADVISRITYAAKSRENLMRLHRGVIGAINGIVRNLVEQAGIQKEEIYEAVVVGNTTMSHLFLGVDPAHLAPAPFVPAFCRSMEVQAEQLGLELNPAAAVTVLPNIAGYVGSDTVAVMLAACLDEGDKIRLAIDIGTNGEIVLVGGGRILTCSTAAGPAFEGAQIKHGMRAADGAIEKVWVEDDDVAISAIGGQKIKGICGSGLVDSVAALFKAGVIAPTGRLKRVGEGGLAEKLSGRLKKGPEGPEFVLAASPQTVDGSDIVLTQKDIRELQLAKGALHAGVTILLKEMGITPADLDQVLLAGAFGSYIDKESALAIGLLPDVDSERVISVGNAAGDGARMALVSLKARQRAIDLAQKAEHVELSVRPEFQQEFVSSLNFPVK